MVVAYEACLGAQASTLTGAPEHAATRMLHIRRLPSGRPFYGFRHFCHRADPDTPIGETVWAMHNLITQGKVLYWGTSEWTAEEITEAYEFAEKNLHRCDSICLKIFCVLMVIIAYLGGILGHVNGISTALMGWLIIGTVITITILRMIMFIIMDSKGV